MGKDVKQIKEEIYLKDPKALTSYATNNLTKANRGHKFICPYCNSGNKGDSAFSIMEQGADSYFKCFSCDKSGDILDLIAITNNLDPQNDFKRILSEVSKNFGIDSQNGYLKPNNKPSDTSNKPIEQKRPQTINYKLNGFYKQCLEEMQKEQAYTYLKERGISEKLQKEVNIGYCSKFRARGKDGTISKHYSKRVIIPIWELGFLARALDDKEYIQKQKQGIMQLYAPRKAKANILFIVEGEIDLLSIYEAGYDGIALGATSGKNKFINWASRHRYKRFILLLDNDKAGRECADWISQELTNLKITHTNQTLSEGDPNEFWVKDPQTFKDQLELFKTIAESQEPLQKLDYSAPNIIKREFENVANKREFYEAKTGFKGLDNDINNLYGGIHEGLYFIGAVSSLGKTTFCLQLASQISNLGKDALFFSLEMSKRELMAKCISRNTFKIYRREEDGEGNTLAKDTAHILNNKFYKNQFSQEEKDAYHKAIKETAKECRNLYIIEGGYGEKRLTASDLRDKIEEHISITGNKPIVFIDYLQILEPAKDYKGTDKQGVDLIVSTLKAISRDLKIPVIAISSFNRDSYSQNAKMESFKESGSIEYSSDILLALDIKRPPQEEEESKKDYTMRLNKLKFEFDANRTQGNANEIRLKALKNRNGNPFVVDFWFLNKYNYFEENIKQWDV